jgi:glutamate dehydrogenase/leucine dehydrogenase/CBS domain-containing protein
MIPKRLEAFLRERLPDQTWENRLICEDGLCFMEFGPLDVDRLSRLGIQVDALGPRLLVCMWDERSELEVGGYLVVDNLAMGRPSLGGIRMLPDVTPAAIYNLARGMTLKNAAADLPFGGGKAGIVAERSLTPREHTEVVKRFAHLIYRYHDIYIPGPDVGTNDSDMKTIAIENGLDNALSKPLEMGGNRIDQLGAAAGGTIIALRSLLSEMPKLRVLSQFGGIDIPNVEKLTVLIQGFGAVGAHAARILCERMPGAKVIGISDAMGYLYDEDGLPIDLLFKMWEERGLVTQEYYDEYLRPANRAKFHKYSNAANDLLRESAFCLIPAAPIANYLDVDSSTQPSMTVARMGDWSLIIEGANTYSPDPDRKAIRARMERQVYRARGVFIATDYLVNSGGVIFAAQERLIKTPDNLRIPQELLGNPKAVDKWLAENSFELLELAEKRRLAAEVNRDNVIRKNMTEVVDLLISDSDLLPCEAAERISIRRIASSERDRTARELMVTIPSISVTKTVQDAAASLVEANSPILAVVSLEGDLVGIITEWDVTRATAMGSPDDQPLSQIMVSRVIAANPDDSIVDVIRKLEYHEISAMPVVEDGCVHGMITADLLATRSLFRLLQSDLAVANAG